MGYYSVVTAKNVPHARVVYYICFQDEKPEVNGNTIWANPGVLIAHYICDKDYAHYQGRDGSDIFVRYHAKTGE